MDLVPIYGLPVDRFVFPFFVVAPGAFRHLQVNCDIPDGQAPDLDFSIQLYFRIL